MNKIFTLFTLIVIIVSSILPVGRALAIEVPESVESVGQVETNVSQPEAPSPVESVTQPEAISTNENAAQPVSGNDTSAGQNSTAATSSQAEPTPQIPSGGDNPVNLSGNSTSGQTGTTQIQTGDASTQAAIVNNGNLNQATTGNSGVQSAGIGIANNSNGSGSDNNSAIDTSNAASTNQTNQADLNNQLDAVGITGGNSAIMNVGSSSIDSGDANVSGVIVNDVNNNLSGAVTISEFNVYDDYVGDIVLSSNNSCLTGCLGQDQTVHIANLNNGAESTNSAQVSTSATDATFQNNNAVLTNELILNADTGNNDVSYNTGGDNTIHTGDANVSGSIINLANNNVSGAVIYNVVNVFGDLVGNIVLPLSELEKLFGTATPNISLLNSSNGIDSTNTALYQNDQSNTTSQINSALINNNLVIDANTGQNQANFNTGGTTSVQTGDASIDAKILNIANLNLAAGNLWLVLVNQAGTWVGRIINLNNDTNQPAENITLAQQTPGTTNIANTANGTDSVNSGQLVQNNASQVEQVNEADVNNNILISANTGQNKANFNTGGDNIIETGDANVIVNLINFLNNNISGNLILTIVNVFGNWMGDLVIPGQEDNNNGLPSDNTPPTGDTPLNNNPSGNTNTNTGTGGTPSSDSNTASSADPAVSTSARNQILSRQFSAMKSPQVAGVSYEQGVLKPLSDNTLPENIGSVTKVNLAWLLLILPGLAILIFTRKKLAKIKIFR